MSDQSLAKGAPLTQATFDYFVQRLKHDCEGAGVDDHCTADAIFIVQQRRIVCGFDPDFTGQLMVGCEESQWFSPQEYWDHLDEDGKIQLDLKSSEQCGSKFLNAQVYEQWEVLGDLDDHTVTGWNDRWDYVNSHFTKDAAEAFIKRKKHDYPDGIRVYVDAQIYCWEYNAIKEALMRGQLVFKGSE